MPEGRAALPALDGSARPVPRVPLREYARPARCLAPRAVHRRFCIDQHERVDAATGLPLNVQVVWTDATARLRGPGRSGSAPRASGRSPAKARRCAPTRTDGAAARPSKCNADKSDLVIPAQPWLLKDAREPAGAHPQCASPFGLVDMAGNVAEWVSVDGFANGSRVVQKGNWWQPGKHACRDAQGGHDRFYKGTETGFRCCGRGTAGACRTGDPRDRALTGRQAPKRAINALARSTKASRW